MLMSMKAVKIRAKMYSDTSNASRKIAKKTIAEIILVVKLFLSILFFF
jgi:hypothetical protein